MFDRLLDAVRAVLPPPLGRLGRPVELGGEVTAVPDDLPPSALEGPVRIDRLTADWNHDHQRAEFRVVVRDVAGKRCPNLAVEAVVVGPTREATAEITTDLMGAAVFRMADGSGDYRITVKDVGAGGIRWDPDAGAGTQAELRA